MTSKQQPVAERFLLDVSRHRMRVVRDDDVCRHLVFRNPESGINWFEVVTWPGVLTIRGDCGCYVFSRIDDMFEFFRGPVGRVNLDYWSQKVIADDRDGVKEFSKDIALQALREEMEDWPEEVREEALEQVRLDDWGTGSGNEHEFYRFVYGFKEQSASGETYEFSQPWERTVTDYTVRFQWNCHAIVWAIAQYDALKQQAAAGAQA